jgi:hypothetical protein
VLPISGYNARKWNDNAEVGGKYFYAHPTVLCGTEPEMHATDNTDTRRSKK